MTPSCTALRTRYLMTSACKSTVCALHFLVLTCLVLRISLHNAMAILSGSRTCPDMGRPDNESLSVCMHVTRQDTIVLILNTTHSNHKVACVYTAQLLQDRINLLAYYIASSVI
jgi:uncharacterized transporter YbjL